ncbi:hypothetical protein ACP70R_021619 [Stipagrostis hirtigluma subsp. patula]
MLGPPSPSALTAAAHRVPPVNCRPPHCSVQPCRDATNRFPFPPHRPRHGAPLLCLVIAAAAAAAVDAFRAPAMALFVLGDSTVSCAAATLPPNRRLFADLPAATTRPHPQRHRGVDFDMGAVGQKLRLAAETLQLLRLEDAAGAAAARCSRCPSAPTPALACSRADPRPAPRLRAPPRRPNRPRRAAA